MSLTLGVIIGSTRPGRNGAQVAQWVCEQIKAAASGTTKFTCKLIDIADFALPLLDEPMPAGYGIYSKEHTKQWAQAIAECDAYIFVVCEYNRSPGPALTNAVDFLAREWNDKVAGFVSYGGGGGVCAVEHLRCQLAAVQVATVRNQVAFTLGEDFVNYKDFKPRVQHVKTLSDMIAQVERWAVAFATMRKEKK
jgi:NAD(P)H-dependent FMN reductase